MRVDSRCRQWLLGALLAAAACQSADEPSTSGAPTNVTATALSLNAVRVTWTPSKSTDVTGYQLERRTDFTGPFEVVADAVRGDGSALVSYFDTKVEPDHYYGYRVRAVTRLGGKSEASTVAGAKTATVPGLVIRTSTTFATAASADPDGYTVSVRGPKDTSAYAVPINGTRVVSPLPKGTYTAVLRGLAVNCNPTVLGDTIKSAGVTDEGLNTVGTVTFTVSCRDPQKASIVVTVRTTGDTIDPDGVLVTVSGIIREAGTPANERVYFQTRPMQGANPAVRFDDLRPGDYEITLSDVESPCVLNGNAKQTLQPKALAVDTIRFGLTCTKPFVPVDTVARPLVLRHTWSTTAAKPGDKVSLLTSLDLRSIAATAVSGASATIQFDNTVVRFDSVRSTRAFDITPVNQSQPNILSFAAAQTGGEPLSGNIDIFRSWFTVVGTVGSKVTTSTTVGEILTPALQLLNSKVRVAEGTLNITATGGGSGGGTTNQAPTAVITGPTAGTAGVALTFSGSGSTDADGTIASYAWSFGDGQTGSGASVSKTFAAAGTYTVRLTVTDNAGATGSREQIVTITAAAPTAGTISGTVSSGSGALAGVTVSVTGGGTATTSATGAYSISNVPAGSRAVSVSGLPATCTAPAAQTVTVTAGATVTANFIVTCTTGGGGGGGSTTGSITGKLTRASDGSGIGFARIVVQPTGAAALSPVSTSTDGSYTVTGVAIGAGTVSVLDLPTGCTTPAAQSYSGLAANATVTVNIAVTCAVVTTGSVSGRITKSTGGDAAGVSVTLTPSGATALPAVTTSGTGTYSVGSVPTGGGAITLGNLPSGCTAPAGLTYSGVTGGGTVTKDITLTCVAGPFTYPLSAVWGSITNAGPTGRQAALTFTIDMGAAPGRADVAGANADPMAGITLQITYDGTKLAYQSRTLLSADEFDLGVAGTTGAGTATSVTTLSVASTSAQTKTGSITFVRVTFNIGAGVSGSFTPTVRVTELLATTGLQNVTESAVVQTIPTLVVPP